MAAMAVKGNKIRLRSLIVNSYTPEQWQARFKKLDPTDQYRLWAQVEPKEVKIEQDTTISLIINGVRQVNAIDSAAVKALGAHNLNSNDQDGEE